MSESWRCPRCGTVVATAWPSGAPVVGLSLERVFHQQRPEPPLGDGTTTREPAGYAAATVCLTCGDALWNRLREVLRPLVVEEREPRA